METYPLNDTLSHQPITPLRWYKDLAPYPLRSSRIPDSMDPDCRVVTVQVDEFHCRLFDLGNTEDLKVYQTVKQRIVSGWYTQAKELTKWDEDAGPVKVWLEWVQTYKELQ